MVERISGNGTTRVIIDTGPDFRSQMLAAGVQHIDAVVYTHPHADLADDGQCILDYYDAVVLIPENPLLPGVTYAVTLTIDGQVYNWNFSVAPEVITNLAGIVR